MGDDIAASILCEVSNELRPDLVDRDATDTERIDHAITWLGYVVAESTARIIREMRAKDGHADDQPGSGDGRQVSED